MVDALCKCCVSHAVRSSVHTFSSAGELFSEKWNNLIKKHSSEPLEYREAVVKMLFSWKPFLVKFICLLFSLFLQGKQFLEKSACCSDAVSQKLETVFYRDVQHREKNWKYDAQRSIFNEIRGVWIADETLSRVFDISVSTETETKE